MKWRWIKVSVCSWCTVIYHITQATLYSCVSKFLCNCEHDYVILLLSDPQRERDPVWLRGWKGILNTIHALQLFFLPDRVGRKIIIWLALCLHISFFHGLTQWLQIVQQLNTFLMDNKTLTWKCMEKKSQSLSAWSQSMYHPSLADRYCSSLHHSDMMAFGEVFVFFCKCESNIHSCGDQKLIQWLRRELAGKLLFSAQLHKMIFHFLFETLMSICDQACNIKYVGKIVCMIQ